VPSEYFHLAVAKVDDNLGGELVYFLLGVSLGLMASVQASLSIKPMAMTA